MREGDRRAPGTTRIPFDAMVEVGGTTGPAFEAQAVDVSQEGMHLRTAYLPEVGQPLTCRFDVGPRDMVLASGEVVWSQEAARGGEFGIRFSNLDGDSARALHRVTRMGMDAPAHGGPPAAGASGPSGTKVRLHIDGLGSPMRARVKGANQSELTVGSELGFLQVGKDLELEHAESGKKRPARIDRVEVQIDPKSHVPELVVALRYADDTTPLDYARAASAPAEAPVERVEHRREAMPAAPPAPTGLSEDIEVPEDEPAAHDGAADRVKSALSRSAAKVAPAINAFAERAKTTFALLAARRWRNKGEVKDDVAIPMRRVTAPPPGGGLHAEGRKVVRESLHDGIDGKIPIFGLNKKKMIIGGIAGALLIVGAVAMRKPSAPPPIAQTSAAEAPIAAPEGSAANANVAPAAAPNAAAAGSAQTTAIPSPPAMPSPAGDAPQSNRDVVDNEGTAHHARRHVQVAPFTNGAVSHGNVLRLKMDGVIEKIQGASQATGFTVVVPSRRSLEAAAPLAARDARIATIKVVNDPAGAELSVTFKDGVPNYVVRAKGETLEIVLAPIGHVAERPLLADAHNPGDAHDGPAREHKGKHRHARHPASK